MTKNELESYVADIRERITKAMTTEIEASTEASTSAVDLSQSSTEASTTTSTTAVDLSQSSTETSSSGQ